jgi:hypothetical protein
VRDSEWPERDSERPPDADEVEPEDEPDVEPEVEVDVLDVLDELDDFELLEEPLSAWATVARLAAMARRISDFFMVGLRWFVVDEAALNGMLSHILSTFSRLCMPLRTRTLPFTNGYDSIERAGPSLAHTDPRQKSNEEHAHAMHGATRGTARAQDWR